MGVVTIASGLCSLVWDKTMVENSLVLILLQRGSFFDDRILITQSAVFVNHSSVLQFLWITPSSIGLQLIKAALD